ncbi:hypothetical protein [Saccharibacillus sp. JS10]|uniref:hypothetical protein n=1 Tax=Saccharibacillus sp. JS10 TaxID=2950552 RepID=UPI00210B03AD|nr:hypothetical protein [Saccharibacillus sp. JS10]MCQ4087539.1 hypothetical protein [Saccharibacillus sp. JS10]
MSNEWFELFSQKINYKLDSGLDIEMKDFLGEIDNLKSFVIYTENSKYFIDIEVKKYTAMDVNVMFHDILKYLEYQGMTFYTNNKSENSIEYNVISAIDVENGFYLKLNFKKAL